MKIFAITLLVACVAALALAEIPSALRGNFVGTFEGNVALCTDLQASGVPNPTCDSCCDDTFSYSGSMEATATTVTISSLGAIFPSDFCTESNSTGVAPFTIVFNNVENDSGDCYSGTTTGNSTAFFLFRDDGSFALNAADPNNGGDCPDFDDDDLECDIDNNVVTSVPLIADFDIPQPTPSSSPAPEPSRSARREFQNDDEDDEGFDKYDDEDDISTRYYLGDFVIYKYGSSSSASTIAFSAGAVLLALFAFLV